MLTMNPMGKIIIERKATSDDISYLADKNNVCVRMENCTH